MRLVAMILICVEVVLAFAVVLHPIMTSHKPLAAAINQYRTAPSPATEAEVKRLQAEAHASDMAEVMSMLGLLLLNTCALVTVFSLIRRQNLRLRAAPVTGLW